MISDELQLPLLCICVCKCFLEVNINFEAAQDKHCASGHTRNKECRPLLKSHCAQCARVLAQITTRNGGGGSLRAHPAASARDTAEEGGELALLLLCMCAVSISPQPSAQSAVQADNRNMTFPCPCPGKGSCCNHLAWPGLAPVEANF